jgi:heme exporter protein A
MIQIEGLTKSFGYTTVLQGIDLQVRDGEIVTIVGPNGAGKTTLLRILATLLKPTSGRVSINGFSLSSGDQVRRHIGFVSDHPLIYDNLTVEENLRFYGQLYDVYPLQDRVDTLLELVALDRRRHSLAGTLSRGMQQRLSVARSIIHDPAVLLLDEPHTGLDQQAIIMLQELLRSSTQSRTVVMTTHNLEQGLQLCDRLVVLAQGRIVFETERAGVTLADLQRAYWQYTAVQGSQGPIAAGQGRPEVG